MRPANGTYRLHSDPAGNPPRSYDMQFCIDDAGGHCSFGDMEWLPGSDMFRHEKADVSIRFTGPSTFVAVVDAGEPGEQTYSGTYVMEAN